LEIVYSRIQANVTKVKVNSNNPVLFMYSQQYNGYSYLTVEEKDIQYPTFILI